MKPKIALLILLGANCLWSCQFSTYVSSPEKPAEDQFPQAPYSEVWYLEHSSEKAAQLAFSSDSQLVEQLWVPKDLSGKTATDVLQTSWVQKRILSKRQLKQLRKVFVDRGKYYDALGESCEPHALNGMLLFLDEREAVVGSIYFCPQGSWVEAKPTLRPGISNNFMWNQEGLEMFQEFLAGLRE
ncbi:MAG: hypothetical protein AAF399_29770 [Bacteroidota bacterium]